MVAKRLCRWVDGIRTRALADSVHDQSNRMINAKPAILSSLRLTAVPTRFELAVSSLTGRHVRPLHHGTERDVRQLYRLAAGPANDAFGGAQRVYERLLPERQREIAARLFENSTRAVGRAPQASRQGIWVVEG